MAKKRAKRAGRHRKKASKRRSTSTATVPEPASEPARLGVTAYAKHRGIRHGAVQYAIKTGRLRESVHEVAGGRKQLDVEVADREWDAFTDPAQSERASKATPEKPRAREVRILPEDPDDPDELDPDLSADYHQERAKRERHQAEKVKLEVRQLKGELIEAREVDRRQSELSRRVKSALLGLPNRLGPVLAAQSDAGEVSRVLEVEINQALQSLVQDLRDAADSATG